MIGLLILTGRCRGGSQQQRRPASALRGHHYVKARRSSAESNAKGRLGDSGAPAKESSPLALLLLHRKQVNPCVAGSSLPLGQRVSQRQILCPWRRLNQGFPSPTHHCTSELREREKSNAESKLWVQEAWLANPAHLCGVTHFTDGDLRSRKGWLRAPRIPTPKWVQSPRFFPCTPQRVLLTTTDPLVSRCSVRGPSGRRQ